MLWSNVLLAYDNSAPALRAVEYVGQMFSKVDGAKVTIFSVYDKLPEYDMIDTHFTQQVKSRIHALERDRQKQADQLEDCKKHLVRMGFDADQIKIKHVERKKNVPRDIIDEVKNGGYGTVVIGRRGQSNVTQMLFGSVASTVITNLSGASVVVVE